MNTNMGRSMTTSKLGIQFLTASEEDLYRAAEIIRRGGVIGYPTETVYGLGGLTTDARIISKIINLKGRGQGNPMLILVPDTAYVPLLVSGISENASLLMHRFWPGPLTLVFNSKAGLPVHLTGRDRSIGIRLSSDPVCRRLLAILECPIISTSANPSGEKPAHSAGEVAGYFRSGIDAVVDGGIRNRNIPSTVIDIRSTPARILRIGAVEASEIKQVIGDSLGS
jgi:L-threonylcarbamoyladenylate synthase